MFRSLARDEAPGCYMIDGAVCYLTLCSRDYSKRLAFSYLENIAQEFQAQYSRQVHTVSRPYSFIEFDADERIRDRLISGMSDRELSRKIQLKSLEEEVSMNTVITMMRNVEIEDVHNFCKRVFDDLPATPQRLVEISRAQQADELLQRVVQQTLSGWKEGAKHPDMLDYFAARGEISVLYLTSGTLLMYGRRIIIPPSLREEMLNRLHDDGHFGLNKCRQRAAESVWWPKISIDLKRHVEHCAFCQVHAPSQHAEPLVTTPTPSRPWTHIAADIFHFNNSSWLVTVDLFSRSALRESRMEAGMHCLSRKF
ncbi:Vesicle-trafficking protein SEC22b [Amphibalanus amphitrite]|uniref:RNA-directed DNA polymerase n=1 Tax=Amphibalanus amphitrite TaxID=1232801 RepID=A0A6A4WXP0_AMPAM|nr:Vesicle-trafficking protein SEC22b [Amphibalanus amphitrite]